MRFTEMNGDSIFLPQERVLELSIGGLEAVADGPDGCLLACMNFWRPRVNITPMIRFLSTVTAARLHLLRGILDRARGRPTERPIEHKVPTRIDVVVRVPRVLFPTEEYDASTGGGENAPMIVVDLGTLHLHTNPQEETRVYSSVSLRLSNLQSLWVPSMAQTSRAQRILELISVDVNIGWLSDDPLRQSEVARVSIEGVVDSGKLTVTEDTCSTALKLVHRWRYIITDLLVEGHRLTSSVQHVHVTGLPTNVDARLQIGSLCLRVRDGYVKLRAQASQA